MMTRVATMTRLMQRNTEAEKEENSFTVSVELPDEMPDTLHHYYAHGGDVSLGSTLDPTY